MRIVALDRLGRRWTHQVGVRAMSEAKILGEPDDEFLDEVALAMIEQERTPGIAALGERRHGREAAEGDQEAARRLNR
jgi:hypothetical protein